MRLTALVLITVALACAACAKSGDQAEAAAASAAEAVAAQATEDPTAAAGTAAEAAEKAAAAAAAAATNGASLTFTNLAGEAQSPPDLSNTTAIVVATWCPHSRKYIEVVRNLSNIGLLDADRIAFIFSDEKAHIAASAKESLKGGKIDKNRYQEIVEEYGLNSESTEPVFYDPELFDTLPAKGFITAFPKDKDPKSVPTHLRTLAGETDDLLQESTQRASFLTPEQFRRVLDSADLLALSNDIPQE